MRRLSLFFALLGLGWQAASVAAAPRGLLLGVADGAFTSTEAGLREEWMSRAEAARANLVELGAEWSGIAPANRPAGFEAANPADPAYAWEPLDEAVRSAVAHGMAPVLQIEGAPAWAEAPNRPSFTQAPAGTWLPDPPQLGEFSQAIAARYSGHFVDPAQPGAGPLPHVRYFEIWGEENLAIHLNPLWKGHRLVAPQHYRAMLNAAYEGIHGVNAGARVLVGGLAPYGDAGAGGARIQPVSFWRSLLCLGGAELRPLRCPDPAHFDIAAHNPINVGPPNTSAFSPLDVSTPDIGRLTRIVRRAVRAGRALPTRPKPFWATEIWWNSKPPNPRAVPIRQHARFITEALFDLWRQGVSAVIWWYLRDQAPIPSYAATQQSGLFYRNGRPKPAFRAFRFPFIAVPAQGGRLLFWGKAPQPGLLIVERRRGGGWGQLARPLAGRNGIFVARLRAPGNCWLRARQGRQASLPWWVR